MQANEQIRVGLVEDQQLFREGMKAILDSWENIRVVLESPDGYSVMDRLAEMEELPHVLLVDLSLPPLNGKDFGGKEVTEAVKEAYPEMGVIVLSIHEDENFIVQLIEHGANGYLVKDSDPREVYEAIVSVHTKNSYINERMLMAIRNNIGKKQKPKSLTSVITFTRREEEVLSLICRQKTSEEIAGMLFISIKTVNGHRNNLLQKTGARNTAGLVVYALKNDLVEVDFHTDSGLR
jgi:two-component system, NarL family, response regulator NreC